MRLLADCGNSRVKLGVSDGKRLVAQGRVVNETQAFDAFLVPWRDEVEDLILLPGARVSTLAVLAWWHAHFPGRRWSVVGGPEKTDLPLPELGQYPGMGPDRIIAGLAAGLAERHSLIVVDAGTATTLSAWQVKPAETDPCAAIRFVGGLILPSARACLAGLAAQAPALPLVEVLGPEVAARQHDTAGAIGAAMGIGYGPMVAACLLKLQRETGFHAEVATGGNAELLVAAHVVHPRALRPALVLEGLDGWSRRVIR